MIQILLATLLAALPPARDRAAATSPSPDRASGPVLSDQEVQERVETLMGTIDTRISADEWRALGPRGAALLEQIAQDPKALPSRRMRAVAGVSAIGAPSSSTVLLGLAKSEQAPVAVRLAAVHGAAKVVPAPQLGAALKPVLEGAKDALVRGEAAEILSQHGGCGLVRAQAAREDDRLRMQRAVDRCSKQ
ncbi:MAG TPA: hypothetical protein VE620_15280 [Myxococcales bacterium]|nr:hypothetical protein [Myxococcales bacterium]